MTQVRTSATDPLRVDWLDPHARVGMTLGPGIHGGSNARFRWERDLDADLEQLRKEGATALVCLMEDHEFGKYKIPALLPRAAKLGLEVLRLPIVDVGVPANMDDVDALLDAMATHEAKGGRLVIHCRGGIGRTGTIAGCYLARTTGKSPAQILEILHRVRKDDRCPETEDQEAFIAKYARRVRARTGAHAPAAPAWYATSPDGVDPARHPAVANGSRREVSEVRELLEKIEREVAAAPASCFSFAKTGHATLTAAGRTFAAGKFSTPTIGDLRARAAARAPGGPGKLTLSVLHGAHALTDIGTLQATAPPRTLFQVASQFNCLEAPAAHLVPVSEYPGDPTQGPRASVSAFPGTFLRHYRAPSASDARFVQTSKHQLNLLGDAFDERVAKVHSGYLKTDAVKDMTALAAALVDRFDQIRVGVHAGVEVVFGYDWGGPVADGPRHIDQVFTSTIALGGYSRDDGSAAVATVRRQLLRAAYLGTLLAALDLDAETVILTLIGGGAFANPIPDIWAAIHWALAEIEPHVRAPLQVLVNNRNEKVSAADRAQVRARGGSFSVFGPDAIDVQR